MIDALSLDQLRMFIAAAESGSFSAAGRKLRRAQSLISQWAQFFDRMAMRLPAGKP